MSTAAELGALQHTGFTHVEVHVSFNAVSSHSNLTYPLGHSLYAGSTAHQLLLVLESSPMVAHCLPVRLPCPGTIHEPHHCSTAPIAAAQRHQVLCCTQYPYVRYRNTLCDRVSGKGAALSLCDRRCIAHAAQPHAQLGSRLLHDTRHMT